jgi:hypothetical protein
VGGHEYDPSTTGTRGVEVLLADAASRKGPGGLAGQLEPVGHAMGVLHKQRVGRAKRSGVGGRQAQKPCLVVQDNAPHGSQRGEERGADRCGAVTPKPLGRVSRAGVREPPKDHSVVPERNPRGAKRSFHNRTERGEEPRALQGAAPKPG